MPAGACRLTTRCSGRAGAWLINVRALGAPLNAGSLGGADSFSRTEEPW